MVWVLILQFVSEVIKILKGFDDDVVDHLMNNMKEKGVKFITGEFPYEIEKKVTCFMQILKNQKQKNFIW